MKNFGKLFLLTVFFIFFPLFLVAYGQVDIDGNGIQDDWEPLLAQKFSPSLVLNPADQGLTPEPVSIVNVDLTDQNNFIYADAWNAIGQLLPPFTTNNWTLLSIQAGSEYNFCPPDLICPSGDYSTWPGYINGNMRPPGYATNFYHTVIHPDFGGPLVDSPSTWYAHYAQVGYQYPPTIYPHLFLNGNETVVQYWMFYPFNDWVGKHEGDWEHINVVLDSSNPDIAAIIRVEYYFHDKVLPRYPPQDFYLDAETHPVVFVGGHGSRLIVGKTWTGEGSHGSYPTYGTFEAAGGIDQIPIADETFNGYYRPWDDFNLEIIPNPDIINYTINPEMSWLKAKLSWGELVTEDSPPGGNWFAERLEDFLLIADQIWEMFGDNVFDDFGNIAPPGPAYNTGWNRVWNSNGIDYNVYPSNDVPAMQGWSPPGPPPPFSVTISGPSFLGSGDSGTWYAEASGGTYPYTYHWEYKLDCPGGGAGPEQNERRKHPKDPPGPLAVNCEEWTDGGNVASFSLQVSSGYNPTIKLTVTDGLSATLTSTKYVTVSGGGTGPRVEQSAAYPVSDLASALPTTYALESAYPNPFNPTTEIRFALPESAPVSLVIYDVTGREVARLVDGTLAAGYHRVQWEASAMPSGLYLYRLTAGTYTETRRMILMK